MPRKTPNEDRNSPVRRCILTGERADQRLLIRLALGPDGQVAPDIHGKAPGRGAWIGVPAEELEAARAKGKLAGLLKRAFKVSELSVSDDIVTRIRDGLEKATLDRLGLEARASNLLSGAEKVDAAARGGAVELLLHASDASDDGAAKRDQSWRVGLEEEGSGRKGMRLPVDRDRLSAALGRANSVHVAITDAKAAERVKHHLERWLYFIGCSNARGDAKADRRAQTAPDGN
ncbi:DUF448 domain-containing protein [Sphingorhabdus buctiana]|uniref:DUF448 domain-containing protein n=1 Tax=Sphingorhabdus buctiana TaxID=1508805 RepID=A0ABW4M9I5_9SPHN